MKSPGSNRSWHLIFAILASVLAIGVIGWKASKATRESARKLGVSEGYKIVGDVPVQHRGRVKPLDTVARLEVKTIYGREEIKLLDDAGKIRERWSALGAFLDWPVRPAYWDDQEILLIDMFDFLRFKQTLLLYPIRDALAAAAGRESTSAADRERLEAAARLEIIAASDLESVLKGTSLLEKDRETLGGFAAKLGEGRKWVSTSDLENARVPHGDGVEPFVELVEKLIIKKQEAGRSDQPDGLDSRENRYVALGERLLTYQAFRDNGETRASNLDITLVPLPFSQKYLDFTGSVLNRIIQSESPAEPTSAIDTEALAALSAHLQDLQSVSGYADGVRKGTIKLPGQDPQFDRGFTKALRESARWVPLRVLSSGTPESFEAAGYDREQFARFQDAWVKFTEAEAKQPGEVGAEPARALLASVRDLGQTVNPARYPSEAAMARESHFNRLAPFGWAPWAYGLGLVLLLISLGVQPTPGSWVARLGRWVYGLGLAAFVLGLGLEVYGFYLRVRISGWAPVTNMYETVIWVAFGAALIGLILELIYRKRYAATAASGIAFLATLLSANVPLLDGNIANLSPVLRDNYWLTVHVITIVSSYAAFSLAMGFGLLGLHYYLGATYRRDVSFLKLILPLPVGIALAALGFVLLQVSDGFGSFAKVGYWSAAIGLFAGLMLVSGGIFGCVGELANRNWRQAMTLGLDLTALGALGVVAASSWVAPTWWWEQLPPTFIPGSVAIFGLSLIAMSLLGGQSRRFVTAPGLVASADGSLGAEAPDSAWKSAEGVGSSSFARASRGGAVGGTATLEKPSVAEIRARLNEHQRPPDDGRTAAIQWTMAHVKPLSNFIYRAMQIGVLLVAAGTILGGYWADKSWGRFWGWDAKEVWALITLLIYLVPLHGRFAGWVSTFGLVGASVFCYMAVLMAWYGVNFVLNVGLHTYGFTEGGGQYLVCSIACIVLGAVLGAGWRRALASRNRAGGFFGHSLPPAA